MIRTLRFIAVLAIAVLAVTAAGGAELEINLESAAELALGNNRQLLAGYSLQKPLERAKRSGWNEFMPQLYVGTGLVRTNDTLSPVYTDPWNVGFMAGARLDFSAGAAFSIASSRLAFEQGLISLAELEHRIVRDSRKAFLQLLLIRDVIFIYENMIETAEDRFNRASRRFELGDIRRVDVLSFQVAWQAMLPQLEDLRNTYQISLLDFGRLLGLPEDTVITLAGDIPAEEYQRNADQLIGERLNQRYDVRSARLTIEQISAERNRRLSDFWTPTFSAEYQYIPLQNDPFGAGSDWYDYQGGLTLWLTMPLDGLIPGTKTNLAVRELNEAQDAAELQLGDTLQAGAIQIESAVRNLNKSSSALRSLELNVVLAEENYSLVSRSYDVGEADYIQVQTADDDMNTARIQLVNERFNYASALQDLNYAVAGGMDAVPTTTEGEELEFPYPTDNKEGTE